MPPVNPTQRSAVVTTWIPVIVAFFALVFTGLTYYMTYGKPPKPFDPSISTGTPLLRETPFGLSIAVSLPLTNNGDDPGCIADIGLTLQSKTLKTQWSYFPVGQINLERYLKAPASKEDAFLAIEAPVSPVKLPGKGTHQQVVLFMPRAPSALKLAPLHGKDLKPGEKYAISVFLVQGDANCQTSTTSKYQQYASLEFVLDEQNIRDLSEGITVLPLDKARDDLREGFVGGRD